MVDILGRGGVKGWKRKGNPEILETFFLNDFCLWPH